MQNIFVKSAILGGAFCILSLGLLYTYQDKMLYLPGAPIRHIRDNPRGYRSPDERNIKYQLVQLAVPEAPNDVIQGWYMYHDDLECNSQYQAECFKRNTVVFFHENAGNLGLRLDYFNMLYSEMGFNVVAFAYRGYSDSTLDGGFPSEKVLKQDAKAIVTYVREELKKDGASLFLIGRSLGGAVATFAATIEPDLFDGIILENTFTSISDMVDSLFYLVSFFKYFILRIDWDTKALVSTIKLPMLIITGDKDEIVPAMHSKYIFDAAKMSYFRQLYVVEGGTHNDTWRLGGGTYRDRLNKFMAEAKVIMSRVREINSRIGEDTVYSKSSVPHNQGNHQNSEL